jgi:lysophospholipase L1-like esterase
LPWKEDRFWDKKTATMYNETTKIFCQKNNIPFIDLTNVLSPEDIEDGLHPNAQGHEKIFQVVKNFLIEEECIS